LFDVGASVRVGPVFKVAGYKPLKRAVEDSSAFLFKRKLLKSRGGGVGGGAVGFRRHFEFSIARSPISWAVRSDVTVSCTSEGDQVIAAALPSVGRRERRGARPVVGFSDLAARWTGRLTAGPPPRLLRAPVASRGRSEGRPRLDCRDTAAPAR